MQLPCGSSASCLLQSCHSWWSNESLWSNLTSLSPQKCSSGVLVQKGLFVYVFTLSFLSQLGRSDQSKLPFNQQRIGQTHPQKGNSCS